MNQRRAVARPWPIVVTAVLAVVASMVVFASPVQAAEYNGLITDNVVAINETVSDAGFVHPGVGLSAEDLRTTQEMVRSGQEPWASYFDAMSKTGFASTTWRASNALSAAEPDKARTRVFDNAGMRGRETNDSFGALTQSLMWVTTGDEVYRKNAIQALRVWADMDPNGYTYFPDAHIHTGHPLYQFLMAAEIIRATEPADDDTPGQHDGYDVVWSAEDDERLLGNFANPVLETFLASNHHWMNQHNFGLFGRIATAIYSDDAAGYAKGVEWYTVNEGDDAYDNGSMAEQMPLIEADNPINPYGYDFVQVREMGRDQAHGETNIDNFAGLARMVELQGTKVDPVDGTVSTAEDAVSAYDFLDQRLLQGAEQFYKYMQGAWMPWVDERGEDWFGTVSQSYRGRIFNTISVAELYYEYKIERGVDVEAEAPWLARLASRMDGPIYTRGSSTTANFWVPGDKNPEYWVAFPEELAGTVPPPSREDPAWRFDKAGLLLDDRTELVTEGGQTFARASLSEEGTTSAMSRVEFPKDAVFGLKFRSDGPARLEVLHNPEPSGLNPHEAPKSILAVRDLPDTDGEWRYVAYPMTGNPINYFRLSGAEGTTVDMDSVITTGAKDLTPPQFPQADGTLYLAASMERTLDVKAVDTGGNVSYSVNGLPEGASFDTATGDFSWTPGDVDRGRHEVQIIADDGQTVQSRTFELVVAANRPKTIDAMLADLYDPDAVYETASAAHFDSVLREAKEASESGTDEAFLTALEALRDAAEGMRLLNPRLEDGGLDISGGMVTPHDVTAAQVDTIVRPGHTGNILHTSFVLDFGTRFRVAAEEFAFQGPFAFAMRSAGTNVYGSNDGIEWDLLSERPTAEVNSWEHIPVIEEHREEQYRFLKLQVDEPALPNDPAYPGIWIVDEFHIMGERTELPGAIDEVSFTSPGALRERVTAGDTAELKFTSDEAISDVAVEIGGHQVEAVSEDGLSWKASLELGEDTPVGDITFSIDYSIDGEAAPTVLGTTDFSRLYFSDERNIVDPATFAEVVDDNGASDAMREAQAALMLDGKVNSIGALSGTTGEYHVTWDFGAGRGLALDRVDFLTNQDPRFHGLIDNLVFQGSNDLQNWTTLTEPAFRGFDWQNLESDDDTPYRYLRLRNRYAISISEFRLFGDIGGDLDTVLEQADAVNLEAYTRGSRILFPREVAAVREAREEPGADEDALARRLIDAWNLLDPLVTEAPAALDRAWVTASTVSWDGQLNAADNGWRMFDGDPGTWTDTTTKSCTNTVLPTDGTGFEVVGIRYFPKDSAANRATNMSIDGSSDGGATWTTFANTGTPVRGWNTVPLAEPVRYGALRLSGGNGYCNVAELEFLVKVVDKTGIDVLLADAAALNEADWTPESWAALVAARDAAQAAKDGKGATQEEVDTAVSGFADAIAGLTEA
ncbi:Ig domain-containing protein [Glycomyces luteolus]|uniref:Ig domain-containing protein n=1 Tax=Glycomyces luteolus TaxID=2670330 RepID=A0A9X3P7B9_9ACTN|nr:Ig domain-containing protein [Glycomyces luteolus]MDA1358283.1 Ig domain-containing protein [Glycomyces luteolus]